MSLVGVWIGASDRGVAEVGEIPRRAASAASVAIAVLAQSAVGRDAGPLGGIDRAGIDAEVFAGTSLSTILVVNIGHVAQGGTYSRSPARLEMHEATTTL